MNDIIGRVIAGRYRVETFLGKGGMAEVYKVWDQERSVYLAMKLLHHDLAGNKVFLQRFKREARTLARLQHPNIVRFYGLEQADGYTFILMDFISGSTLRDEIRAHSGPLPPQRILQVMRDVCAALRYAHKLGYIHCDVKPANIMLSPTGSALVSDFGIAHLAGIDAEAHGQGGTPHYMAPEQIRGEPPTPATDIYALGVLLYEMLTGGLRPFNGTSAPPGNSRAERIRWEQIHLPPPSPRGHNPAIHPELETIIMRCLEKDPGKRYPDVNRLLQALDGPLQQTAIQTGMRSESGRPSPIAAPQGKTAHATGHLRKVWIGLLIAIPVLVFLVLMIKSGGTTASMPPFTIRPYNPAGDQNADCIICRIPDWEEPKDPGTYHWDVVFPADTPVYLSLGWCAIDQNTLDENWSLLSYEGISVDGYRINLSQLSRESGRNAVDQPCYAYAGILANWPAGQHEYTEILNIRQTLNDGMDTYQAGRYIFNFTVDVR